MMVEGGPAFHLLGFTINEGALPLRSLQGWGPRTYNVVCFSLEVDVRGIMQSLLPKLNLVRLRYLGLFAPVGLQLVVSTDK